MVLLNKLKHTGRYIKEKKTILRVNKHQGPRVTVGGQGSTQPVRHMYTSVNLQNPTPSLGLAPSLPPPPKTKGKKYQKDLPSPSTVKRRFQVASARGPNVDFDLRLPCAFWKQYRESIRLLTKEQ